MSTLSKDCFAYPAKNKYPIHTKEAALSSYEEFKTDIQDFSEQTIKVIADNFIKAAALHNITYKQQSNIKSQQMIPFTCEDGTVIKITKVANAEDVQSAVQFLKNVSKEIPLKDLRKVAQAIFVEADKTDAPEDAMKQVHKFAGIGFGQPSQMVQQFCKRGALINMPQSTSSVFYQVYRDLNDATSSQTMFKISTQLCDILDSMDRMYKLSDFYGTKLKAPQDVCFSQGMDDLILQAQDYLPVVSTGTIMSKTALLQNKDKVQKFFLDYYDQKIENKEHLFNKVASLSQTGIKTLIQELQ